jgi:hypothetical protein
MTARSDSRNILASNRPHRLTRLIDGCQAITLPIKRPFVINDFIYFLSLSSTYKIAPQVNDREFFGRFKISTYNIFIIQIGRYLSVTLVTIYLDSLGWSQRLAGKVPSLKNKHPKFPIFT